MYAGPRKLIEPFEKVGEKRVADDFRTLLEPKRTTKLLVSFKSFTLAGSATRADGQLEEKTTTLLFASVRLEPVKERETSPTVHVYGVAVTSADARKHAAAFWGRSVSDISLCLFTRKRRNASLRRVEY